MPPERVVVKYLDDEAGVGRPRDEETVAPCQKRGLAIAADVRPREQMQ